MLSIRHFLKAKIHSYFKSASKSAMFDLVRPYLVGACAIPGVTGCYLSHDAVDFVLTGTEWTPELSRAAADLCVLIRTELQQYEDDWWLHGGFSTDTELPSDCEWIIHPGTTTNDI